MRVARKLLLLVVAFGLLMAPPSTAKGPSQAEKDRASNAVFYAGKGNDGFDVGRRWGAIAMGVDRAPRWAGDWPCDTSRAVPAPPYKTPNRLVGFSLGRLGPAYYLQQLEKRRLSTNHIRTVVLLDPGSKGTLRDRDPVTNKGAEKAAHTCDVRTGAAKTYREWLKRTPGSYLLIIAGPDTQRDYGGIKELYAPALQSVRRWVKICQTKKVKAHRDIPDAFGWLIGTWERTFTGSACPEHTEQTSALKKQVWGRTDAGQGGPDDRTAATEVPGVANVGSPGGNVSPTVSLSLGPPAPKGFRYAVALTGFAPNRAVTVTCHDSVDPGGFFTFALTTDGAGNASTSSQCYSADGPDHWVRADGVESNYVTWSGSTPAIAPPPAAPASRVWPEQQGSLGANTFTNPYNASGMGPKIPAMSWFDVSCKVYAPQIVSANPDGYWYRIASAPWSNRYYAVANTFWNGDVPGRKPYTHNTDLAVADC